ncbi:TIGR03943 family putative permease subunit [Streptomyces mirabilis]|uniref:TIGR03943 family putative permease subunit n=1 Tax=Streptomyces mirabilis TaxID=68239 RepID=UPI003BEF4A4D
MLLVLSGVAVLRISLFSDLYLRYVQAGLRPYLIVSGVLLLVVGIAGAVLIKWWAPDAYEHDGGREHDAGHGDDEHEHGHDHSRGPRVAWLLMVPVAVLLLFPPPALGSYSADREAAKYAAQGIGKFSALPKGEPVDLTLSQFSSRAIYDSAKTLKGRTVRMIGFVTKDDDGTWYLTRLLISCCAADARADKVEIRAADAPPADSWVTVTGTWHPRGKLGSDAAWPPALDARSVKHIKKPESPYEKR